MTFKTRVLGGSLRVMRAGRQVSRGSGTHDGRVLRTRLRAPVRPARYRARWTALASDGHRQSGVFTFKVR